MLTRRRFLKRSVGLVAVASVGAAIPWYWLTRRGVPATSTLSASGKGPRALVVVELYGGNDGLNTVIPYQSGTYYEKRPTLAVPGSQAVPISADFALHPSLKPLASWYQSKQLAIIMGVGYPNPNLSHFRSMDIWWSGDPGPERQTGWLGRYLDATASSNANPLRAVSLGSTLPKALVGKRVMVPSLESLQSVQFVVPGYEGSRQAWLSAFTALNQPAADDPPYLAWSKHSGQTALAVAKTLGNVKPPASPVTYPNNSLATQLKIVSQLVATGIGTEIFYVSLGGFDDHAAEGGQEANTLSEYATAMDAFFQDLKVQGKSDQVVALTYSEFGRRVLENASGGTDHGTAAPIFLMGGSVKGGIYGDPPSLDRLDTAGNLVYTTDFRQVYSNVLEEWLGGDPTPAVGKRWPSLSAL